MSKVLFKIDTKPSERIQKKLDSKRFQRKMQLGDKSAHEEKIVKGLVKKLKTQANTGSNAKDSKKNEVFDLWGTQQENLNTKPSYKTRAKEIHPPSVIVPHPGQSINPTLGSQKDLMKKVVDTIDIQRKPVTPRPHRQIIIKEKRPTTKKGRIEFAMQRDFKREKEIRRQQNNALNLLNEAKVTMKKHGKYFVYFLEFVDIKILKMSCSMISNSNRRKNDCKRTKIEKIQRKNQIRRIFTHQKTSWKEKIQTQSPRIPTIGGSQPQNEPSQILNRTPP